MLNQGFFFVFFPFKYFDFHATQVAIIRLTFSHLQRRLPKHQRTDQQKLPRRITFPELHTRYLQLYTSNLCSASNSHFAQENFCPQRSVTHSSRNITIT